MENYLATILMALFFNVGAWADVGGSTLPTRTPDNNDLAYQTQSTVTANFQIKLVTSCFPTNVRNVANPVAPGSIISGVIHLIEQDNLQKGSVEFSFPATLSIGTETAGTATVLTDTQFQTLIQQLTQQTIANPKPSIAVNGFSGTGLAGSLGGQNYLMTVPGNVLVPGTAPYKLDPNAPITFNQYVPQGWTDPTLHTYIGTTGPLSANITTALSSDGSQLVINAAFPGSVVPGAAGGQGTASPTYGLCGSYYSPLMIFLSSKRPKLTSVASFPLRPEGAKFFWPEGSKDWAFLVLDDKGDGKITTADQLFGNNKYKNGFEALRKLDSNHDGKIDEKDQEFAKIKLWFDLNGDGKVDTGELKTLKEVGIESFSLNYKSDVTINVGHGAFMEYSKASGGKKSYDVIDVWFGVQTPKLQFSDEHKGATSAAGKTKT